MKPKIGILIATRNRKQCVRNLLNSLLESDIKEIVISASGQDLTELVHEFSLHLPVKYMLGDAGQIRQKLNGISVLSEELDWVIFSDDDLEFSSQFLSILEEALSELSSDVIGVGLNLQINNIQNQSKVHRFIRKVFNLQNGKEGSVQPNGECVSYLNSKIPIETFWLNGASVWRRKTVEQYNSIFPETKYAAYEDAFFSHAASKTGRLLYRPDLKIKYSGSGIPTMMSSLVFLSVNYWKLLFVLSFKLSLKRCLFSIFGSTLIFLFSKSTTESIRQKVVTVIHLFMILFIMFFVKNKLNFMLSAVTRELRAE